MLNVLTVVGARPQFVKAAVVSKEIAGRGGVGEAILHTGQHYSASMSSSLFEELGIAEPSENLEVGSGPHGAQTAAMIVGVERAIERDRPDWVLVYGDTNSTLAAAIAAAKLHVPIAHVEAGLRSFNRRMPEEVNRVLTDHASEALFAPTTDAVENLHREGLDPARIHLVGDVMFDAVRIFGPQARWPASFAPTDQPFVLATIHRAETTDEPGRLRAAFEGLAAVARHTPVVLPLHPRTSAALRRDGTLQSAMDALTLVPPVSYLEMLALERGAAAIATDSGGVQKEAFFNSTPCVTLRDETEWVELVEAGWNTLCPPTEPGRVETAVLAALRADRPAETPTFYGDGFAARRIVDALLDGARS